jgi:hypothetical protein
MPSYGPGRSPEPAVRNAPSEQIPDPVSTRGNRIGLPLTPCRSVDLPGEDLHYESESVREVHVSLLSGQTNSHDHLQSA